MSEDMFLFTTAVLLLQQNEISANNGTSVPKVFGGTPSRYQVHKYLVQLEIQSEETYLCSGSIIGRRWIVTSAHCFPTPSTATVSQNTTGNSKVIGEVLPENIHLHPEWSEDADLNNIAVDIALVKTSKRIKFNEFVQPIELAWRVPRFGQSAIIAGYGEADVDTRPTEGMVKIGKCPGGYKGAICSDEFVRAGSGDSGGPLVWNGRLVGVTAASCAAAEEPSRCLTIFASIPYNKHWIRDVMENE